MAEPVSQAEENNQPSTNAIEEITSTAATEAELLTPPAESKPAAEPSPFSKPCDICQRLRDVLIRCQTDSTGRWQFVCPGKCWTQVSGGMVEGDSAHPFYKYGGTWKNKHEYVSAKIKGKAKAKSKEMSGGWKGPHRRSGHWRPKAKKLTGDMVIRDDDGGSDIEVSDVEEDVEFLEHVDGRFVGESHVQVKKADEV